MKAILIRPDDKLKEDVELIKEKFRLSTNKGAFVFATAQFADSLRDKRKAKEPLGDEPVEYTLGMKVTDYKKVNYKNVDPNTFPLDELPYDNDHMGVNFDVFGPEKAQIILARWDARRESGEAHPHYQEHTKRESTISSPEKLAETYDKQLAEDEEPHTPVSD